jgi:hypothetical protein
MAVLLRHAIPAILSFMILGLASLGCSGGEVAGPANNVAAGSITCPEEYNLENLTFGIEAKYNYVRSCPEGGGVLILRMIRGDLLSRDFQTKIGASGGLNARLAVDGFNEQSSISEVVINPDESIAPGLYEIIVYVTESGFTRSVELEVDLISWENVLSEMAIAIRDDFTGWLETEHPELGTFSDREWFSYLTYPGILVVEHWTFLDIDWEMRICFHVTIPPYDWSMLMLRERGEWDPIFAARRDSDGPIYEIPVAEYPIMFGY